MSLRAHQCELGRIDLRANPKPHPIHPIVVAVDAPDLAAPAYDKKNNNDRNKSNDNSGSLNICGGSLCNLAAW